MTYTAATRISSSTRVHRLMLGTHSSHSSALHRTQHSNKLVDVWKVFSALSITELFRDHSLPSLPAAHLHPKSLARDGIDSSSLLMHIRKRINIGQKLDRSGNKGTQQEQSGCSFAEKKKEGKMVQTVLRYSDLICTQLHVQE